MKITASFAVSCLDYSTYIYHIKQKDGSWIDSDEQFESREAAHDAAVEYLDDLESGER